MEGNPAFAVGSGGGAGGALRLLTLNLGLLAFEPRSRYRILPAVENAERLAAAPALLSAVGADVIALQEVYRAADQEFLMRAMAADYPFNARSPRSFSLVGNGLLVLSRLPISSHTFTPCRGAPRWTGPLWSKGFLAVEVDVPAVGRVGLINVHIAASLPFGDPDAAASEQNRQREIGQLLTLAAAKQAAILVGDFNTSEEVYPDNYWRILAAGYADAFVAAAGTVRARSAFTWHAENPLNSRGRFRDFPSQRIDHVFVREAQPLVPVAARVVFDDKNIDLKSGRSVPLSDHYGMLVALAR